MNHLAPDEPCYPISVVARMVDLHPQTLRLYERMGLIIPARSPGNVRLYSELDIDRLRRICRLTDELGVNLAAVEVIMRLTDTIEQLQDEMETMRSSHEAVVERLSRMTGETGPITDEEER